MGVMGTLGMNQMRPNGTIPYSAQQRFAHAQMRPQQVSQQGALSPQVLLVTFSSVRESNYLQPPCFSPLKLLVILSVVSVHSLVVVLVLNAIIK
jgi:hypothetical protein